MIIVNHKTTIKFKHDFFELYIPSPAPSTLPEHVDPPLHTHTLPPIHPFLRSGSFPVSPHLYLPSLPPSSLPPSLSRVCVCARALWYLSCVSGSVPA